MPYAELPAFLVALRARPATAARALEFAILTAARTGEVIGARWQEMDLEARIWTVPAERMKAGREHRVPLSDSSAAILKAIYQTGDSGVPVVQYGAADALASNGPYRTYGARIPFNFS